MFHSIQSSGFDTSAYCTIHPTLCIIISAIGHLKLLISHDMNNTFQLNKSVLLLRPNYCICSTAGERSSELAKDLYSMLAWPCVYVASLENAPELRVREVGQKSSDEETGWFVII